MSTKHGMRHPIDMVEGALPFSEIVLKDPKIVKVVYDRVDTIIAPGARKVSQYTWCHDKSHVSVYPYKLESDEGKRMSLTTSEVLDDFLTVDPRFYTQITTALSTIGLVYDDIACGFIIYTYGLYRNIGLDAIGLALRAFSNFERAKELSTMIKSLGLNTTLTGAMLCEINTLLGRGAGHIDLDVGTAEFWDE